MLYYAILIFIQNDDLRSRLLSLIFMTWRITKSKQEEIANSNVLIHKAVNEVLRHYAAIQFQSIVRGFLARVHLKHDLQRAAEANRREIQQWSILILQKVARGYIARKTLVRSMKIRKQLSKEVLWIAEKFMVSGDMWGFLQNINEELERSKKALQSSEAREDNWASKFVEKVVAYRQSEFNESWDRFPAALQEAHQSNVAVGSLIDGHRDLSKPDRKTTRNSSNGHSSTGGSAHQQQAKKSISASTSTKSKNGTKKGVNSSSIISEEEVVSAMNFTADTHLPVDQPHRMPGPLLRKALQTTVKTEVASQLNKIMHGTFHTKKLAQDIAQVYGPESDTTKRNVLAQKQQQLSNGAPNGGQKKTIVGPLKQKKSLDGKLPTHVGQVTANTRDWLHEQPHQQTSNDDVTQRGGVVVQPGNSLLLDVPLGLDDSIERLMHAAALRCYVPDFFRGATESLAKQQEEQSLVQQRKRQQKRQRQRELKAKQELGEDIGEQEISADEDGDNEEETQKTTDDDYDDITNYDDVITTTTHTSTANGPSSVASDEAIELHYARQLRQRQESYLPEHQVANLDPRHAYRVYLSLPLGLAKIRYESECKKWSQGYINQLRIKGLHQLSDVLPVSKFMTCLVNVHTPRVLRNMCIDLCLDLKNMGAAMKGHHLPPQSLEPSSQQASTAGSVNGTLNGSASISRNDMGSRGGKGKSRSPTRNVSFEPDYDANKVDVISVHSHPTTATKTTDNYTADTVANSASSSFRANLDNIADIDETMRQVSNRNAVLAQQTAALSRLAEAQSQANQLLQSLLEDVEARWCKLTASIDDFFVQAAFLIVPHIHHHPQNQPRKKKKKQAQKLEDSESHSHRSYDTDSDDYEEGDENEDENGNVIDPALIYEVAEMGNAAFKAYAMELYTLSDESAKEDFVRARFRSAVILTTPFTLYLKKHGVQTVQDFLKVELHDLQLPPALHYQLEVLLTIVVGRQVHAKVLPTATRVQASDLSGTNAVPKAAISQSQSFAVPLLYDPRFQRTPLDPFGRPPVLAAVSNKLQQQARKTLSLNKSANDGSNVMASTTRNSSPHRHTGHTIKQKLRLRDNQQLQLSRSLQDFDNITSMAAVTQDLENHTQILFSLDPSHSPDKSLKASGESENSMAHLWTTTKVGPDMSSSVTSEDKNDAQALESVDSGHDEGKEGGNINSSAMHLPPIATASSTATNTGKPKRSNKRMNDISRQDEKPDFIHRNMAVRPLDAFKETHRCHYPGCNQVFARAYTFKVHLKTHEMFPQYHAFKQDPQLLLDSL